MVWAHLRWIAPIAAGLLATSPASGQEAPPEDPERIAQARAHFEEASRHYQAERFREAIREFELSSSLVPSADLAYNIARCHERLDDPAAAISYYERYLREKIDPPDRAEVEQRIGTLKAEIEARRQASRARAADGLLHLEAMPAGAAVAIDGRPAGRAPLTSPLRLAPGAHRLYVTHAGYQDWVAQVEIRAGDATRARADLEPRTVHESVRGGRLWTYVAGGATVLAVAGGVVLGIAANGTMSDAQAAFDRGDEATARSRADDARAQANRADFLYGGALVLGVATAVLWFVEGSSVETETRSAVATR